MAEKNLYYLHELSDYTVASDYPDVRGWRFKDCEGKEIGKIDNLLVNKEAKRVVYLDVETDEAWLKDNNALDIPAKDGVHGFVNKEGENHLIVPIGLAAIDEQNKLVCSNAINSEKFSKAKRHSKGEAIQPAYEMQVYKLYTNTDNDVKMDDTFYKREAYQHKPNA